MTFQVLLIIITIIGAVASVASLIQVYRARRRSKKERLEGQYQSRIVVPESVRQEIEGERSKVRQARLREAALAIILLIVVAMMVLYLRFPPRKNLRWGVTTYQKTETLNARFDQPFKQLEDLLPDIRFSLHPRPYKDLLDSLIRGDVDIAGLSPYAYIYKRRIIESKAGTLQVIGRTNRESSRASVIVANVASNLHSVADLAGRSDITLILSRNEWSTSRHVVPKLLLKATGINVDEKGYDTGWPEEIVNRVCNDPGTVGALYIDEYNYADSSFKRRMRILDGSQFPIPTEVVLINKTRFEKTFGPYWGVRHLSRIRSAMEGIRLVYPMNYKQAYTHVRRLEEFVFSPVLLGPAKSSANTLRWRAELLVGQDRFEIGAQRCGDDLGVFRHRVKYMADQSSPKIYWEPVESATFVKAGEDFIIIELSEGKAQIGDHVFPVSFSPENPDTSFWQVLSGKR